MIEVRSGTILISKNADRPVEPAAMAKLMTMAVVGQALRMGETTLDTQYLISDETWRNGGAPARSATMFAVPRSHIRVRDLLDGAIVQAANDACLALSEGLSGRGDGLVPRMNALADRIGLTHSIFRNVTGFAAPGQITTARDLATLMTWFIANEPALFAIYSKPDFTWNGIRQTNRNPLLNRDPGVDGGVTGASESAGFGMIVTASRDGLRYILVVHGLKTAQERADETRRLLQWAETAFQLRLAYARGDVVARAAVFGGEKPDVALSANADVNILVRTDEAEKLVANLVYDGPVRAPVHKGDAIGRLQIIREGQISLEVPLYAIENVPIGSLSHRAFNAIYELGIGLIRGGHTKK